LQLCTTLVGVAPGAEVVAVIERRDGALERQDLQTVAREIQVANDLRPQQTHDVGKHGELEAGKDLLRDRRAADERSAFEDERLASGTRQVCRGNQSIVTAADDDRIVFHRHAFFLGGSKNGSLRTVAATALRRCSMVSSMSTA